MSEHRQRASDAAIAPTAAAPSQDQPIPSDRGRVGTNDAPRCFLHIPKCGGTSIHTCLEAALSPDELATRRMDTSALCGTRELDTVPPQTRALVAVGDDEIQAMSQYRVVSGHFSLPTLLEITVSSSIATVLREPRARLLSLYQYWRLPKIFDKWRPYENDRYARGPLHLFLAEPQLAPAIDNQMCRMLLHGDPRIPTDGFIAKPDIERLAADAIVRLDALGFVGVLERIDDRWCELSRFFGAPLQPVRLNATSAEGDPLPAPPGEQLITAAALDLIQQRSAADRILYSHALARDGTEPHEQRDLLDSIFANQLVMLGDLLGRSARQLPDRARAIDEARLAREQRDQLYAQVKELRDHLDVTEQAVRGLEDHLAASHAAALRPS